MLYSIENSFRLTHNWWHVALCYLEGNSPMEKVKDIYDHRIWKELEKDDCVGPEVMFSSACAFRFHMSAKPEKLSCKSGLSECFRIIVESVLTRSH